MTTFSYTDPSSGTTLACRRNRIYPHRILFRWSRYGVEDRIANITREEGMRLARFIHEQALLIPEVEEGLSSITQSDPGRDEERIPEQTVDMYYAEVPDPSICHRCNHSDDSHDEDGDCDFCDPDQPCYGNPLAETFEPTPFDSGYPGYDAVGHRWARCNYCSHNMGDHITGSSTGATGGCTVCVPNDWCHVTDGDWSF